MKKNLEVISWIAGIMSTLIAIYVLFLNQSPNDRVSIKGNGNNVINDNKGEIKIEK